MVTLFTTGCPRCRVLSTKLKAKGIDFNISEDVTEITDRGFESAPVLKIDSETYLDFMQAIKWINREASKS